MPAPAPILPTATCFDDALDFFEQVLDADSAITTGFIADFRVVHGICHGAEIPEPYAHAWVEQIGCRRTYLPDPGEPEMGDVLVWQAGLRGDQRVYFALPAPEFYRAYRVLRATAYTLELAAEMNRRSGHYGPWRREYRELCRQRGDGRIMGRVQSVAPVMVLLPAAGGTEGAP